MSPNEKNILNEREPQQWLQFLCISKKFIYIYVCVCVCVCILMINAELTLILLNKSASLIQEKMMLQSNFIARPLEEEALSLDKNNTLLKSDKGGKK